MFKIYALDYNHNPVVTTDARLYSEVGKKVGYTSVRGYNVSTIFLAIDHNYSGKGPPILFETMVFGPGEFSGYRERCATWYEAKAQHSRIVKMIKDKYPHRFWGFIKRVFGR